MSLFPTPKMSPIFPRQRQRLPLEADFAVPVGNLDRGREWVMLADKPDVWNSGGTNRPVRENICSPSCSSADDVKTLGD